ncbi:MAG TPA: AHH domain-containing protein [Novosphingobium sp.]|nr:AHH domain-containing protein [Novosphingobium sp.]
MEQRLKENVPPSRLTEKRVRAVSDPKAHLLPLRGARPGLPFRAVNRCDAPDYDAGLQRHHLLPRQLLSQKCFGALFESIGHKRIGFEDFRSNGLLLPGCDAAALRIGLPMHRGPHQSYNALVIERVGQVEARWASLRLRAPDMAVNEAVERLALLQRALRRRLMRPRKAAFRLCSLDPQGRRPDFAELDAMVDSLWPDTSPDSLWPIPELENLVTEMVLPEVLLAGPVCGGSVP